MQSNSIGAGMGTSGLVGQFGTFAAMGETTSSAKLFMLIALMHFILPAIISWVISEWMRKKKYIAFGDMKLDDAKSMGK